VRGSVTVSDDNPADVVLVPIAGAPGEFNTAVRQGPAFNRRVRFGAVRPDHVAVDAVTRLGEPEGKAVSDVSDAGHIPNTSQRESGTPMIPPSYPEPGHPSFLPPLRPASLGIVALPGGTTCPKGANLMQIIRTKATATHAAKGRKGMEKFSAHFA
jgi:hypothetical protein